MLCQWNSWRCNLFLEEKSHLLQKNHHIAKVIRLINLILLIKHFFIFTFFYCNSCWITRKCLLQLSWSWMCVHHVLVYMCEWLCVNVCFYHSSTITGIYLGFLVLAFGFCFLRLKTGAHQFSVSIFTVFSEKQQTSFFCVKV